MTSLQTNHLVVRGEARGQDELLHSVGDGVEDDVGEEGGGGPASVLVEEVLPGLLVLRPPQGGHHPPDLLTAHLPLPADLQRLEDGPEEGLSLGLVIDVHCSQLEACSTAGHWSC